MPVHEFVKACFMNNKRRSLKKSHFAFFEVSFVASDGEMKILLTHQTSFALQLFQFMESVFDNETVARLVHDDDKTGQHFILDFKTEGALVLWSLWFVTVF